MRVGYTTGVFDMFHVGHLRLLSRARLECDHLIVGVTTDELSLAVKHKAPLISFEERREIVGALSCVDRVVAQSSMDKFAAWQQWGFDRIFVGDDWAGTPRWESLEAQFAQVHVEVIYFSYTPTTSSTKLRVALEDVLASPVEQNTPA